MMVPNSVRPLHVIAADIRRNWCKEISGTNVWFGAKPYLEAMGCLDTVGDMYGCDSGRDIVIYFLTNATTWRGEDARRIKAELKALLK